MTINKRGVYDPVAELEKQGYDADALLDEVVHQINNLGIQWEYNDEAIRGHLTGESQGWTAEEILDEGERCGVDLEEYKLDGEE